VEWKFLVEIKEGGHVGEKLGVKGREDLKDPGLVL